MICLITGGTASKLLSILMTNLYSKVWWYGNFVKKYYFFNKAKIYPTHLANEYVNRALSQRKVLNMEFFSKHVLNFNFNLNLFLILPFGQVWTC